MTTHKLSLNCTSNLRFAFFLLMVVCCGSIKAQYPHYFSYNDENGMPSNEVYDIIQDKRGFIWFGCDAGLYKFDGVRYIHFKSSKQQSKSFTDLTQAPNGRLYAHTFTGQLFFVESDSLVEQKHSFISISGLYCDAASNLWVSHPDGLSKYDEKSKTWTIYNDFDNDGKPDTPAGTRSVKEDSAYNVWFVANKEIGCFKNNKLTTYSFRFNKALTSNNYFIVPAIKPFLISRLNGEVYSFNGTNFLPYELKELTDLLKSRKVTYCSIIDGNLWICTYNGLIVFNPGLKTVKLLYPNFSFSHCMKDREENYWLSTLQNGLMRIPNMNCLVWNNENGGLVHDLIYKITRYKNHVYFATVDGYMGRLNTEDNHTAFFETDVKGDIQQVYFDSLEPRLYYTINNSLFYISADAIGKINNAFPPLKALFRIDNKLIGASSFGCFIMNAKGNLEIKDTLTGEWSRDLNYDSGNKRLWVCTNKGLILYNYFNDSFTESKTYLKGTQIISSCLDSKGLLYFVTFDGNIYSVSDGKEARLFSYIPEVITPGQLVFYQDKIYCTSNKGLWILNLNSKKWERINKSAGIASDNIKGLVINDGFLWLATGNGLQKIPLNLNVTKAKDLIYLKKLYVNNKEIESDKFLELNYNQSLGFRLEASNYSSDGKFFFAYRISEIDSSWTKIPANTEQIDILNLPAGPFHLQIKLVDSLGEFSENTISINGNVNPPFWQRWWFYLLSIIAVILAAYIVLKQRLKYQKQKQEKEIERINLENELKLAEQSALKAQMNPHFIFNVLNSIKGYIYENDKKNAVLFLSNFSDLIRKVLEQSSSASIKLEEEIETLKLYIELEAMNFQDEFSYDIKVDGTVDTGALKIPSLLIQPFIENSFKHGLRHKTGNKYLSVKFEGDKNHEHLLVTITDNGIGRNAASKLNSENKHLSFATQAIKRRIELLNQKNNNVISVFINDLYNDRKEAEGTEVKLSIHIS